MSKRDLDEYWTSRERVSKTVGKDIMTDRAALGEFITHKEAIEKQLRDKDPRAMRAINYAVIICSNEGEAIANELYPNPLTRPDLAQVKVIMPREKDLSYQIYDILAKLALAAADEVAPL